MIAGYHIPKGTHMGITIVGLHRNPKVWPNPLKFDPERWYVAPSRLSATLVSSRPELILSCRLWWTYRTPENSKDYDPYSYIPFSAGTRNCIGQKFAQVRLSERVGGAGTERRMDGGERGRGDRRGDREPVEGAPSPGGARLSWASLLEGCA